MLILMMIEDMLTDLGCDSIAVASKVDPAIALVEGQVLTQQCWTSTSTAFESYPIADALKRGRSVFFLDRQRRHRHEGRLSGPRCAEKAVHL